MRAWGNGRASGEDASLQAGQQGGAPGSGGASGHSSILTLLFLNAH